jgi:hypothetical protein
MAKGGGFMKKLPFLVVIIILFAFPTTALANSALPEPEPYDNYVLIDDYSQIASAALFGHDKDNNYKLIKESTYPPEWKVSDRQNIEFFHNDEGKFKDFQVVITFKDGKTVNSNFTRIVEWGEYIYAVKDNTLIESKITTAKPNSYNVFFGGAALIFPLLFTVLIEWLVSLAFRLKPGKYVVIINFISNPLINILLILIYVNIAIDYYLALIILEALVAGAEFWYYTRKYKGCTNKRLLLFTVTANLASWFLNWYLSPLLHSPSIHLLY